MKLVCLAIGKRHDTAIAAAIDDYATRLRHFAAFSWQLLAPAKGKLTMEETKRLEGAVMLAQLQDDDYIVLLDEQGQELTSRGLASVLDASDRLVLKRMVFIIGGAYGVSHELKQRADVVWSLSKLTFPHQLVRLILSEQLYRAYTIRRNLPYHHE
jgi:23S rRNA (pseudouridine1915-N3)-methyltransferase